MTTPLTQLQILQQELIVAQNALAADIATQAAQNASHALAQNNFNNTITNITSQITALGAQ